MPRCRSRVTAALLAAAACSPSEFVWSDAPSAELDSYLASFANACGDRFDRRATWAEMLAAIGGQRVAWLGDHHVSERLHALHRELLAALHARGVPFVLMLEAIGTQDDAALQRFLRGEIALDELRTTIAARWSGSWLDDDTIDAAFYRDVLTFAKEHAVPVLGLEPTPRGPLRQRDARIADAVRRAERAFAGRVVVVLVGQAHLLGEGDLVARTGLGGAAIGGVPPAKLRPAGPPQPERGFWRSTGGLWWFGEVLADARRR